MKHVPDHAQTHEPRPSAAELASCLANIARQNPAGVNQFTKPPPGLRYIQLKVAAVAYGS